MNARSHESRLHLLLEGCGIAILLMLKYLWWHISPTHTDLFHRLLPMNSVYGGVVIDLAVLCLICTGVVWLLDRFDPENQSILWAAGAIILIVQMCSFLSWGGLPLERFRLLIVLCIAAGPLLWLWQKRWYGRAVKGGRNVIAAAGVCIVWMLPLLAYMAIHPVPHGTEKFVRVVSPDRVPKRRVIWVIFDELSQDQMLDHRQPGLELPALDRFRSQSVMFTQLRPVGYYTQIVLPSLLWGKVVTKERSDLEGHLTVMVPNEGWRRFQPQETLIGTARRNGWSSGVAGWYNPYCRTYASLLDWCAWTLRFIPLPGGYTQGKSVMWNANAPLLPIEKGIFDPKYHFPSDAEMHAEDYYDLMRWSHALIDNENIGFVLLHLPLPHPGGFYNRKTGQIGVDGSYIDNLALTDRTLDQLMQWIGATKLAANTTIVLCSDHSWRVPMWSTESTMWTEEDAKASQGRFDSRPVLMVHFPGETTPEVVAQPLPALMEHDLIESLLRSPMDAKSLKNWAESRSTQN
jgi:Sulfatase